MSLRFVGRCCGVSAIALLLANCASEPSRGNRQLSAQNQREIGSFSDRSRYGAASPRVVQYGENVPKGGGKDHVGKPYRVAGRWYTPRDNPNYTAVGHASWYGDAFHGRKTANGEIYDKHSYTAAHPTMPLPSYARVTNLGNNRSIVVRVNDRGPFHGGRIIDLSERVAHALEFKHIGTARVKVDYLQRASTAGSDDRKLVASLRTDGGAAELPGGSSPVPALRPVMVASNETVPGLSATPPAATPRPAPAARPQPQPAAVQQPEANPEREEAAEALLVSENKPQRRSMPLPQDRPFDLGSIPGAGTPMNRVNNGQITPARAVAPQLAPSRDRVAAVYFAPAEGFRAAFGDKDPMRLLKAGAFDPVPLRPVAVDTRRR
jgi:rare lipoprotein A